MKVLYLYKVIRDEWQNLVSEKYVSSSFVIGRVHTDRMLFASCIEVNAALYSTRRRTRMLINAIESTNTGLNAMFKCATESVSVV